MPRLRVTVVAVLMAGWPLCGMGQDSKVLEALFAQDVITVEGRSACHRLGVYLAVSLEQRARGLMFVRELPRRQGMLFIYPEPRRVSMWMKNTLIPLDMIFIRPDGTVANVAERTEPLSLESIPAAEPVDTVLELNAGVAGELGLVAGHRVWLPWALGPAGGNEAG